MRNVNQIRYGVCLVAAMIAATLSACSSSGSSGPKGSQGSSNAPATLDTQIEVDSSTQSSQRGLELRVLTVDDASNRVAKSLAPYESDLGMMDQDTRNRWRSWGLRLVVVPVNTLESLLESQDLTKATQTRWMGEFPQWRPIIRTAEFQNRSVRIQNQGSSSYQTFTGQPRLLARLWTTPVLTDTSLTAQLHLDLAVQITKPKKKINQWNAPKLPTALDDGPLVEELKISQLLDGSSALIIIGQDPSVNWVNTPDSEPEIETQNIQSQPGPSAPQARTLGEYMFSTPGTGYVAPGVRYISPKKVLIVLIPKSTGTYRLLGPTAPNQGTTP